MTEQEWQDFLRVREAAPDLLEALKDLINLIGPLSDISHIRRKNKALAAIAKAEGRS